MINMINNRYLSGVFDEHESRLVPMDCKFSKYKMHVIYIQTSGIEDQEFGITNSKVSKIKAVVS